MKPKVAVSGKPIRVSPRATYPPGTYNLPTRNLSVGQTSVTASATRETWPDNGGDVLSLITNISYDSGKTWQLLLGFTTPGGIIIDPSTQQPATVSTATTVLPQPNNPNRVISGTVTTYVTLKSNLTVTVS
jgi:hypothetical protein